MPLDGGAAPREWLSQGTRRVTAATLGRVWARTDEEPALSAAAQAARRDALLTHASAAVPYWRAHAQRGTPPRAIAFGRQIIRDAFEDSVADQRLTLAAVDRQLATDPTEWIADRYLPFLSAGQDGDLTYFVYDRAMWDAFLASFFRPFRLAGAPADAGIAFVGTVDPRHTLYRIAGSVSGSVLVAGLQQPLEGVLAALNAFRPEILCGYSSALELLADHQRQHRLWIAPRFVFSNTDALSACARDAIQSVWPSSVWDLVGCTEFGVIAFQCGHGSYHLNVRDFEIWQFGTECRATNVVNHAQPIINYRLPLRLRLLSAACRCGRAEPVVILEGGRRLQILRLINPAGRPVAIHPIAIRSALDRLSSFPGASVRAAEGAVIIEMRGAYDVAAVERAARRALVDAGAAGGCLGIRITSPGGGCAA
jgi:phenylacetate-CoA ligase